MTLIQKKEMILGLEQNLFKTLKPKSIDKVLGLEKTATELCCSLILNYFEEHNVVVCEGSRFTLLELNKALCIVPKYYKMGLFFLSVLIKNGILLKNGDYYVFTSYHPISSDQILKKIAGLYPKFHPFFAFVEYCSKNYSEVLSGKCSGVNILFPEGDSSQLERIYQSTPKIGHEQLYLNLLKETLLELMKGKPESKIIEVGAGQGILTDVLMPAIRTFAGEYHFTDIGQAFIHQGQRKYSYLPKQMMNFALYDVSAEPDQQGLKIGSYDFIIGFNVLHATKNVGESLTYASRLLKENGYILLVENIKQQIWIDMIYGLTEGWWLYDDGIREVSPLLTHQQWNMLLKQSGFNSYLVLPEANEELAVIDTSLIVIQKI